MLELIRKSGLVIFLVVLLSTIISFVFKPFSILNYIGPMAGVCASFILLWGLRDSALVFITVLLCGVVASYAFDFSVDSYVSLIGILAVILHSLWLSHITAKDIENEKWLSRRVDLTQFLIKIGPVGAIIIALAVGLIEYIQLQMFGLETLYSFVFHWTLTLLTSVFVISLTLFCHVKKDISLTKKMQVLCASTLGVLAICLLFKATQSNLQDKRNDEFYAAEFVIKEQVKKRIELIDEQLHALAAFFYANKSIDEKEFEQFSQTIFNENSKSKLFAWVPTVSPEHIGLFNLDVMNESGSELHHIRAMDAKHLLRERISFHGPMRFVYPSTMADAYLGIDLLTHPENKRAMDLAAQQNVVTASQPLTTNLPGLESANILVFYPLPHIGGDNPYFEQTEFEQTGIDQTIKKQPVGYVVAIVDVFDLLTTERIDDEHYADVSLFIEDISGSTPFIIYGQSELSEHKLSQTEILNVFNRQWKMTIMEKYAWPAQYKSWLSWTVLLGSSFGGLLYQFLILLLIAYSTELKQKIRLKTKELILAKENSENANVAKSQYLKMLSNEMLVPVKGISGYLVQLKQQTEEQKQETLTHIEAAATHLDNFVHTIKDMAEIETGQMLFNQQSFNFHEFLYRIESMSNAGENERVKKVTFIINKEVPTFIDGDELRLQQIFNALIHNGAIVFNSDTLKISVKAHMHKHASATLFIVVTPYDDNQMLQESGPLSEDVFTNMNTSMRLAHEICQQLGGSIKLLPLFESGLMISASFQTDISQVDKLHLQSEIIDKYQQV